MCHSCYFTGAVRPPPQIKLQWQSVRPFLRAKSMPSRLQKGSDRDRSMSSVILDSRTLIEYNVLLVVGCWLLRKSTCYITNIIRNHVKWSFLQLPRAMPCRVSFPLHSTTNHNFITPHRFDITQGQYVYKPQPVTTGLLNIR